MLESDDASFARRDLFGGQVLRLLPPLSGQTFRLRLLGPGSKRGLRLRLVLRVCRARGSQDKDGSEGCEEMAMRGPS